MEDVLSELLGALRVSGSVILREHYPVPWAIAIPPSPQLRRPLGLHAFDHIVPFHFVEAGAFTLETAKEPPRHAVAGQLLICFGGQAHRMVQGPARETWPLSEVLGGHRAKGPPHPAGTRDATHLICGVFVLRDTALNPLFQALPAVLQLDVTDPTASPWLDALTQNLRRETAMPHPGGRFVVERLLELLCAEALRHHLHTDASAATNWFAGIRDPALAKALAAFHADPAHPWNLEGLAAAANLSRSRLYARFRAYLGDSPMGYVTKWRMNLACRLLGQTELAVEQIAARTGYDSPAAFTRAFQRTVGASPSRWRSQLPGGDPGGVTRRGKSLELALD